MRTVSSGGGGRARRRRVDGAASVPGAGTVAALALVASASASAPSPAATAAACTERISGGGPGAPPAPASKFGGGGGAPSSLDDLLLGPSDVAGAAPRPALPSDCDVGGLGAETAAAASAPASGGAARRGLARGGSVAVDLSGSVDVTVAAPRSRLVHDGGGRGARRAALFRLGRPSGAGAGAGGAESGSPTSVPPLLSGPSLHLLADYDFAEAWYGVRSVGAGLAWEGREVLRARGDGRRAPEDEALGEGVGGGRSGADAGGRSSLRESLSRCVVRLRSDRDLTSSSSDAAAGDAVSAELQLTKRLGADGAPYPSSRPPSARLRVDGITFADPLVPRGDDDDDEGSPLSRWASRWGASRATASLRAPVHRRVDLVSRSTVLFDETSSFSSSSGGRSSSLAGRVPPVASRSDWSSGTWLPDVRVSTAGDAVGRSEAGFRGPVSDLLPPRLRGAERMVRAAAGAALGMAPMLDVDRSAAAAGGDPLPPLWAGGWGVRLTVRRKVDWSPFSFGSAPSGEEEDERDTTVQLQLCGMDGAGRSYSSATLEAALERPVESARVTLAREQLIQSP